MCRLSLLFLAVLVAGAMADIRRLPVTECPHHPGQCQDPATGSFHTEGEEWFRAGECVKYTCNFPQIVITGDSDKVSSTFAVENLSVVALSKVDESA